MIEHCRSCYPNEACGILAGNEDETVFYPMTNVEPTPVSYHMDSGEQFALMKTLRERAFTMKAIMHSHPESAAYPSEKDKLLAFYEDVVYIIISLAGEIPDTRGFRIRDGSVREVEIATY